MKKVLLGLLALSAVSMAAPTDLTKPAAPGSTIFEAGTEGAIGITGTITSTVPTVKYVVFASSDNGTNMEDTLALTDFVLAQDAAKAGFVGVNPKVYIKKVASNGVNMSAANLDTTEIGKFKLSTPDFAAASSQTWLEAVGGSYEFSPTSLAPKTMLDKIITDNAATLTGVTVNTKGQFEEGGVAFEGNKKVKMTVTENGVLEITHADATQTGATLDVAKVTTILGAFTAGQTIAPTAKILVRVN